MTKKTCDMCGAEAEFVLSCAPESCLNALYDKKIRLDLCQDCFERVYAAIAFMLSAPLQP